MTHQKFVSASRGVVARLCLILIACASLTTVTQAEEPITHSFFVAGKMTGIVGEDGEVIWDSQRPSARDGQVLPNGNVLICWANEICEYNTDREIIWTRKLDPINKELGTVWRLPNGRTMLTELGPKPRLLEVDESNAILVEVPLQPDTDNAHMQTRMARKLANGNYLVPHLFAFAVKEYTPEGKVVNIIRTNRYPELGPEGAENWPFTAIRLPNGNTHINLTHGDKVIETAPDGSVVWKASNDDVEGQPFADPCGAQRLPNGNTVIASYAAKEPNKPRMFELTPEKKIVWSQNKYHAHHFQILTTNGKPLEGEPMR